MHLLTGGTGFIGAYVAGELLRRGDRVAAFDIAPDPTLLSLVCGDKGAGAIEIRRGDVAQATQFLAAVADLKPQTIVHLASPLPPASEADVAQTLRLVTQAHINVFEAARLFGVRRVVWASATSVFGPPERHGGPDVAVADDAPHYPTSLYGITKSANERLARFYYERDGTPSIGLRFAQGYGPGKSRGRPFGYELFERLLRGDSGTLPYGDDVINWQYIGDIARIIILAIDAPRDGARALNTSGEVLTADETIQILRDLVPEARIEREPGTAGIVWRYRTDGLARDLGFTDATPAGEGFRQTIETMRKWQWTKA